MDRFSVVIASAVSCTSMFVRRDRISEPFTLETALVGREVGQILDGQIAVPLVVRYPHADKPDLEAIRDTPLRTSSGAACP
jgi:Cu/Ag efflux pump CusA